MPSLALFRCLQVLLFVFLLAGSSGSISAQTVRIDSLNLVPGEITCDTTRQYYLNTIAPHVVVGIRANLGQPVVYSVAGSTLYVHELDRANAYLGSRHLTPSVGNTPVVLDVLQTANASFACGFFAETADDGQGFVARIGRSDASPSWVSFTDLEGVRAQKLLLEDTLLRVVAHNRVIGNEIMTYRLNARTGASVGQTRFIAQSGFERIDDVVAIPSGYAAVGTIQREFDRADNLDAAVLLLTPEFAPTQARTYLSDLAPLEQTLGGAIVRHGDHFFALAHRNRGVNDYYLLKFSLTGGRSGALAIGAPGRLPKGIRLTSNGDRLFLSCSYSEGTRFRAFTVDPDNLEVLDVFNATMSPGEQPSAVAYEPTAAGLLFASPSLFGNRLYFNTIPDFEALRQAGCNPVFPNLPPGGQPVTSAGVDLVLTSGLVSRPYELVPAFAASDTFTVEQDPCTLICDTLCSTYTVYESVSACATAGYPLVDGRTVNTPGTYTARVTTMGGCDSTVVSRLDTFPAVELSVEAEGPACLTANTGFVAVLPPQGVAVLTLDGRPVAGTRLDNLPGGLTYPIVAVDTLGCTQGFDVTLSEGALPPEVELPERYRVTLGDSIRVGSNSLSGLNIAWTDPDSILSCTTCPAPWARPLSDSPIRVDASSPEGCTAAAFSTLEVIRGPVVDAPNAFSPNGDGSNDRWRPFPLLGFKRFVEVSVFDRWGSRVYYVDAEGLARPDWGWDGTSRNRSLDAGVFVYQVVFERLDGSVGNAVGDLTLLR